MSTSVRVVLGPPGTGKTTFILGEIDRLLRAGVDPSEIGFYSFTRAACNEAKERAADRFGFDPDGPAFTHWRTLHSQAYRLIGRDHGSVMKHEHWSEFGEWANLSFSDVVGIQPHDSLMLPAIATNGDKLLHIYDLMRLCRLTIDATLRRVGEAGEAFSSEVVAAFIAKYESFKRNHKLLDFVDMLVIASRTEKRPAIRYAYFDEAQDNCALQAALVQRWALENPRCEKTVIVGDDDQAIYVWSGAEPGILIDYAGRYETQVLEQSHRIPARVHEFAQRIIAQNRARLPKVYRPRAELGSLRVTSDASTLLDDCVDGSVMILCRNVMFADSFRDDLLSRGRAFTCEVGEPAPLQSDTQRSAFLALSAILQRRAVRPNGFVHMLSLVPTKDGDERILPHGVKAAAEKNERLVDEARLRGEFELGPFVDRVREMPNPFSLFTKLKAKDRDYLAAVYKRDPNLSRTDKVTITTMHRSKGRQAKTVILSSDCASATYRQVAAKDESENRVAYVAATRAEVALAILRPTRRQHYDYEQFVGRAI
jgi:DNA helicase-2/ATP-dependent DNA helicase PcrA